MALPLRLIETIGDDIAGGRVASDMLRPAPSSACAWRRGRRRRPAPHGCCASRSGSPPHWPSSAAPPDPAALAAGRAVAACWRPCNLACQHAVAAAAFWIRDAQVSVVRLPEARVHPRRLLLPLRGHAGVARADGRVAAVRLAMAYAPARLASGHLEPHLLAVQAGWVVVLLGARRRGGVRRAASAGCRRSGGSERGGGASPTAVATLPAGRGRRQPGRLLVRRSTAMIVNDLAWVGFWFLFFDQVGSVRGWDLDRVLLLFAVAAPRRRPRARRLLPTPGASVTWPPTAGSTPRSPCPFRRWRTCWPGGSRRPTWATSSSASCCSRGGRPDADPGGPRCSWPGCWPGSTCSTGFLVALARWRSSSGGRRGRRPGLHAILSCHLPGRRVHGRAEGAPLHAGPGGLRRRPSRHAHRRLRPGHGRWRSPGRGNAVRRLGWATFTLGLRRYTSGAAWTRA